MLHIIEMRLCEDLQTDCDIYPVTGAVFVDLY